MKYLERGGAVLSHSLTSFSLMLATPCLLLYSPSSFPVGELIAAILGRAQGGGPSFTTFAFEAATVFDLGNRPSRTPVGETGIAVEPHLKDRCRSRRRRWRQERWSWHHWCQERHRHRLRHWHHGLSRPWHRYWRRDWDWIWGRGGNRKNYLWRRQQWRQRWDDCGRWWWW